MPGRTVPPFAIRGVSTVPPVRVVGAGLGGLAAAVHLAAAGRPVVVHEARREAGGKAGRTVWRDHVFDTGPSVLTIPRVLDQLFAAAGRRREEYVELVPVEPGCRYVFADGSVFDAPGRWEAFRDAAAGFFDVERSALDRFHAYTSRLWEASWEAFLTRPMTRKAWGEIPLATLKPALALLRPGSLHRVVRAHFRDPRLVQFFDRFATYNGSDPRRTPSAFNVIAHAELEFGSWTVRGGIHVLVDALRRLVEELGGEVRLGEPVERVVFDADAKVRGIDVADGRHLAAAGVVVNADALTARTGPLLAMHPRADSWRRAAARAEPSGSGYVVLAAIRGRHPALATHNVIFSGDYPKEFREQFRERVPLSEPTIYVSVPARHDTRMAPPDGEGWFILVNAPAIREDDGPEWPADYGRRILETIGRRLPDLADARVRWMEERSPRWFAQNVGAWRGTLYGRSSNDLFAAFRRVPNLLSPGLACCGGSAHPGGGIPLVLLSGRMAAQALRLT